MFKKILIGLLALLVIILVAAALQPSDFRITRSAGISAPPATVFAQVNELQKWEAWSPWVKLDPAIKQTYEGPSSGQGAISRWAGNSQVGEGNMTITEAKPNELVRIRLEFVKPFAATNQADFTFQPQGNQTLVTWTMTGKNNFVSKLVGLFFDMEKVLGGQFEQGLAQIKSISEAAPAN